MANFVRSDSSEFTGQTQDQQPIVLARLPKLGAESAMPESRPLSTNSATATSTAAVTSTATALPVPTPETMPQLELRSEIDQRIKLHIADTPPLDTTDNKATSPTTHFADRRHVAEPESVVRQPAPTPAKRHSRVHTRSATTATPMTFSEKLFQLHSQVSPHAGLIVALALIASAGLLYWMIVGPVQTPMPQYEDYGPNYRDEGLGAAPLPQLNDYQPTEDYLPEFAGEVPHAAAPASVSEASSVQKTSDQWTKVPLPTPIQPQLPQQMEPQGQLARPTEAPATLQELPAVNELMFPTTDHPNSLDFSKAGSIANDQPATLVPQQLPAVANRNTDSTTR